MLRNNYVQPKGWLHSVWKVTEVYNSCPTIRIISHTSAQLFIFAMFTGRISVYSTTFTIIFSTTEPWFHLSINMTVFSSTEIVVLSYNWLAQHEMLQLHILGHSGAHDWLLHISTALLQLGTKNVLPLKCNYTVYVILSSTSFLYLNCLYF